MALERFLQKIELWRAMRRQYHERKRGLFPVVCLIGRRFHIRDWAVFGAMVIGSIAGAAEPIKLHPDNPHYFLFRGKPTILITSAEHYGAVMNLDFDYVAHLDTLAGYGFNNTRIFSGTYRESSKSFGIPDNTLAPRPNRYVCPWARSGQPGYADGGNKFDLTKWDRAYFTRLRDFMKEASKRGIVVEYNFFSPNYNEPIWKVNPMNAANNVNGIGKGSRKDPFTLKEKAFTAVQVALVHKIAEELRDFDNLHYEVCNEALARSVSKAWHWRIADAIVEAEKSFPAKHLISMNPFLTTGKVKAPHPGVSIYNFHAPCPPVAVTTNYGLNRVIGDNETSPTMGGRSKGYVKFRTEGWQFILAGGGLFNHLDLSFSTRHPRGDHPKYSSHAGGATLRQQIKILKDFVCGFDFVRMKPDTEVVKGGVPGGVSVHALAERGKAYAIYLRITGANAGTPGHKEVSGELMLDLPAGSYRAEWLNPITGRTDKAETFRHEGGEKKVVWPSFAEDMALRVRSVE